MAKITIFGQAGTGTTTVGEKLAEILEYPFLSSGNEFRKKAMKLGIEASVFESLCLKEPKYDLELDNYVAKFGKENAHCVVESRLAYHFIPDSIKVKLICNYYTRVSRVAKRQAIPFSVASEQTNKRELATAERYYKLYGIKKLAPDNKFLVIDTSRRSPGETVKIIISKFKLSIR